MCSTAPSPRATGCNPNPTTPSPSLSRRTGRIGAWRSSVARQYDLGFIPLQDEHYDFVVPKARLERSPVRRFRAVLDDELVKEALRALKFGI